MDNRQLQRSRYSRIQLDRERERSYAQQQQHLRSSYNSPPPEAHSSTPPIGVPQSRHHDVPRNIASFENGYPSSELLSPIEQAARQQRGSISFDPHMRTEEGRFLPLEEPLPKPPAVVAPSPSNLEGQKIARESDFVGLGESFHRSNSPSSLFGRNRSTRMRRRQSAASKFLQQTSPIVIEGVASLTSDSTLSPMSEFHTPPSHGDTQGEYFSTHRNSDSYDDPVMSPGNMSPWMSPRKLCTSMYGSSLSRSSSRGTRGSLTSTGASPASLFLNNVNSPLTSQTLEPDSEGQEIGAYVLGKQIGFGGFSTVKEAITIENNREIKRAVKIVRKRASDADSENDRVQAEFEHEVSLWRLLNHPRILKLAAVYDSPFATFAFMPLNAGGTLFDLIKLNRRGLPAHRAQRYSHQLASAIRYLHEDMRIVHADIKLENCLLDSTTDSILLCDFGLAQFITSPCSPQQNTQVARPPTPPECHNVTGSLPYASPELIQAPQRYVAPCIDIWAFGILVYALHTGVLPFTHAFPPKLQNMILKGQWDLEALRNSASLRELEEWRADSVVELVRGCLSRNVARRWDIGHVLGSPWFEGCGEA